MPESVIKLIVILLLIIIVIYAGATIIRRNATPSIQKKKIEPFIDVMYTGTNSIVDQNNKIPNENSVKDCYALLPQDCILCAQCGIFGKDGKYKCVPGDVQGPSFEYDADEWIYGNDRNEYLFNNTVVNKYPPWNKDIVMSLADPLVMAS